MNRLTQLKRIAVTVFVLLMPQTGAAESLRILMIGNSYTNDSWASLQGFFDADPDVDASIVLSTAGGSNLAYHWNRGPTGSAGWPSARWHITENGPWDYVFIQDQSLGPGAFSLPYYYNQDFETYIDAFTSLCRDHQHKVIYFSSWGRTKDDVWTSGYPYFTSTANHLDHTSMAYATKAHQWSVKAAPCGEAFEYAQTEIPGVALMSGDGIHANAKGNYLAAAAMYHTVTGKNPKAVAYLGGLVKADADALRDSFNKMIADFTNNQALPLLSTFDDEGHPVPFYPNPDPNAWLVGDPTPEDENLYVTIFTDTPLGENFAQIQATPFTPIEVPFTNGSSISSISSVATPTSSMSYHIVDGNEDGAFAMDASGRVSLALTATIPFPRILRLRATDSNGWTDDVWLTVVRSTNPNDVTRPELLPVNMVDDLDGGSVAVNEPVTYTITFSESMNPSSVDASDFSNQGDASIVIGEITQIAPDAFTVVVTPSTKGAIKLQVSSGAVISDLSGHPLDTTHAIADVEIVVSRGALTGVAFAEGFESPHVTGNDVSQDPPGWITEGNPAYMGVKNEDGGDFTTPYGNQGLHAFTLSDAGNWSHSATTGEILDEVLSPDVTYTLSFSVASHANRPAGYYQAELVAVDDVGGVTTVLASEAAASSGSSTMSDWGSITFKPDSSHATILGQRIAIRLGMAHDYLAMGGSGEDKPIFDKVSLIASIEPSLIPVPNVRGLTQSNAEAAIVGANLQVGSIAFKNDELVPAGNVIGQTVAGINVTAGFVIDLVVSLGGDVTPPLLTGADIVDDQSGNAVLKDDVVTYTIRFNEDIDEATLNPSDFANAGTAPILIGNIIEISPGVFSVQVTPTDKGTLQLQVVAGASIADAHGNSMETSMAIPADAVIVVALPPAVHALVYEPFSYATGGLHGKGITELGFDGSWSANSSTNVVASTLSYGTLPVRGGKIANLGEGNRFGGSRALSSSALANNGLLDDGATLWFSVIVGNEIGYSVTNARLAFALANSSFNTGKYDFWIQDEGVQSGSGVGLHLKAGKVKAGQYRDLASGDGVEGVILAPSNATGYGYGESGLIVGKITWAANPSSPDIIELFQPGTDLSQPATPISSLSAVLDQSTFDTITFTRSDKMMLDEIRFGGSYNSVTGVPASDNTPPTLAGTDIIDGQSGASATEGDAVAYTISFSEDIDENTIEAGDFANAGSASIHVGAIFEVHPGIFSVQVTPTSDGTLQLQVKAAAIITDAAGNALNTTSAIADDTSIEVRDVYSNWSGSMAFGEDDNSDGIANGIAWVLGAEGPSEDARALLPRADASSDPDFFIFTYRRKDQAHLASGVSIDAQYSHSMSDWVTAAHDGINIIITSSNDFYGLGVDQVEVKIRKVQTGGGSLFCRLNVHAGD